MHFAYTTASLSSPAFACLPCFKDIAEHQEKAGGSKESFPYIPSMEDFVKAIIEPCSSIKDENDPRVLAVRFFYHQVFTAVSPQVKSAREAGKYTWQILGPKKWCFDMAMAATFMSTQSDLANIKYNLTRKGGDKRKRKKTITLQIMPFLATTYNKNVTIVRGWLRDPTQVENMKNWETRVQILKTPSASKRTGGGGGVKGVFGANGLEKFVRSHGCITLLALLSLCLALL